MALSRETIDKLGFVNKDYFLFMDDVDYITRANTIGLKARIVHDCHYFHPYMKVSLFYNTSVYFTIRNHLLYILKNPNPVATRYKLFSSGYLLSYLAIKAVHFIQLRDPSIIKTAVAAVRDFISNNITLDIPENNFAFEEINPRDRLQTEPFPDLGLDRNRVFIRKGYRVRSSYNDEARYFKLTKL